MFSTYPVNAGVPYPFKGTDQALVAMKMEHYSGNNSVISQSQETGLSADNMANETTSLGDIESSNKGFNQELEGLSFSPNMSDLDCLWNY